jgi:hypothetical protein
MVVVAQHKLRREQPFLHMALGVHGQQALLGQHQAPGSGHLQLFIKVNR